MVGRLKTSKRKRRTSISFPTRTVTRKRLHARARPSVAHKIHQVPSPVARIQIETPKFASASACFEPRMVAFFVKSGNLSICYTGTPLQRFLRVLQCVSFTPRYVSSRYHKRLLYRSFRYLVPLGPLVKASQSGTRRTLNLLPGWWPVFVQSVT